MAFKKEDVFLGKGYAIQKYFDCLSVKTDVCNALMDVDESENERGRRLRLYLTETLPYRPISGIFIVLLLRGSDVLLRAKQDASTPTYPHGPSYG
ncbi:hypothetical protein Slin_6723 (plasmid) [Spirosoma linguale DSM 74]|uniref:Uncharacterized protein n=1 Tax=Spirosoma linguale (strain ATCC 33905 / DSM 74 / LMG 10896 / Claus 1) TaxID=504472 RepID=D2QV47_SPILD|nr:hypothetical protein Slin_6723 [Spirosoma linguale DSM 74]